MRMKRTPQVTSPLRHAQQMNMHATRRPLAICVDHHTRAQSARRANIDTPTQSNASCARARAPATSPSQAERVTLEHTGGGAPRPAPAPGLAAARPPRGGVA